MKRVAIAVMIERCDLSERRACRLAGLSRDSYRHPPEAGQMSKDLTAKIVEIARARRRFGYRRIHDMLRPDFHGVNHKRVYRLYSEANLAVRRRMKVRRPASERVPLQLAQGVNEVWSMDFVSDSLASGRRIKFLTVADDFSHECVDITADWGISGLYVTRLLDRAARHCIIQAEAETSPRAQRETRVRLDCVGRGQATRQRRPVVVVEAGNRRRYSLVHHAHDQRRRASVDVQLSPAG